MKHIVRDEFGQLAGEWTKADLDVLAILEDVCSPTVDPDRSLAAYLADIKEAMSPALETRAERLDRYTETVQRAWNEHTS